MSVEHVEDLTHDVDRDVHLRFGGRARDVRREHGARRAADGGVGRQRLARVDVERGAGDRSGLQRGRQRRQVDDLAARAVHDDGGRLHLRERVGVDEVARLLGERRVQRDEVRAAEQLVELDQLRAGGAGARLRRERVVRDDVHLEGGRAARDLRTHPPDADEPQRLAAQLAADELRARPLAGADAAVGIGDSPEECERERERVLGRGDDVPERRVHDVHAARGGRGHVDVVDTHPGAPHHRKARGGIEDLRGDLRLAAHDQRVDVGEVRCEIGLGQTGRRSDLAAFAEQHEAVLRERIGHVNDGQAAPRDVVRAGLASDGSQRCPDGRRRGRRNASAAARSPRTHAAPRRSPDPARPAD